MGKASLPGTNWPLLAAALIAMLVVGVSMWKRTVANREEADSVPVRPMDSHRPSRPPEAVRVAPQARPFSIAERHERRKALQAEQVRRGQASHRALAARYNAEPVNAAWARPREAVLLAASDSSEIRLVGATPGNFHASCHSTTCRIGADFPNKGAMEDWLTLFSTGNGGALPFQAYVVAQNPDGGFHLDVVAVAKP